MHGAVGQGVLGILDQRAPLVAADAAREDVRVVGGMGHHDEHLAVPRIERDDRPVGRTEGVLGRLLEVAVEREGERVPGHVGDLL